jgi:hypothetical protein
MIYLIDYFRRWPHVLENWIKFMLMVVAITLLPGWWALLPLLILVTLR